MCLLVLFALKITLLLGTDLPVLRLVTTVSLFTSQAVHLPLRICTSCMRPVDLELVYFAFSCGLSLKTDTSCS